MNGWANWETWNASLWIGNDEFLYSLARRCINYRDLLNVFEAAGITETGDGLRYDDENIDTDEMDEMLEELCDTEG